MKSEIFKVTEKEVVDTAKEYFNLKNQYEKAMDERRYSEATNLIFKKENRFFRMELGFDKTIREGRAEKINYQMSYEKDYEYFLKEAVPYILVRKRKEEN